MYYFVSGKANISTKFWLLQRSYAKLKVMFSFMYMYTHIYMYV